MNCCPSVDRFHRCSIVQPLRARAHRPVPILEKWRRGTAMEPAAIIRPAPQEEAMEFISTEACPTAASAIDFMMLLRKLKTTPRTGWVHHGVDKPESIADHMYRMAALALVLEGSSYDSNKCVKLCIVHDMAEAIVGDIAPCDNVSDESKHSQEAAAISTIKGLLGEETPAAREIEALWWEYEKCSSKEAQLVKDFDKLEMILQAKEYETEQGKSLQDFFDSTAGKWKTEYGKALAVEVVQRRITEREMEGHAVER